MAFEKTKEQIAEEQRLLAERYPETVKSDFDPTQSVRDALKRLASKGFIPNSPMEPSGWSTAGLQKEQFEMSPEMKKYGYDLFGIKNLAQDSEQQIPFAPQMEQAPEMPSQPKMEALPAEQPPVTEQPNVPSLVSPKEETASQVEKPAQVEQQPSASIDELIKQSGEAEKKAQLSKSVAKFRNAIIGAGLGKEYKGDLSSYDERIKASKKPLENLLLKQELETSQAKNDPNSALSNLAKKSLQDLGLDMQGLEGVSFAQLEKLYPSLTQALYGKMTAQARLEEARTSKILTQQTAEEKKQAKVEAGKESDYRDLYKKAKSVTDSDAFSLYKQAIGANRQLDQALSAWNESGEAYKVQTSAAFMNYAKTAQQDKSVVRESDMKVLAGGTNYGNLGSLVSKFAAKGAGSAFSPEELKQFKAVMNTIASIKRVEIKQNLNPILKKAGESNLDTSYLIDPEVMDDIYNQPPTLQEQMNQMEQRLKSSQSRIDELKKKQGSN
jgi:hypothetical protein